MSSVGPSNVDLAVQGLSVKIVGYNCRFKLGFNVDMRLLAASLLTADYNPRYPTVRVRLTNPQCCISVSYHGHCTIFGCESVAQAATAAAVFLKLLDEIEDFAGLARPSPLTVVSITCLTDLGHGVRLDMAAAAPISTFSSAVYQPEIMPSLQVVFKVADRNVCCSVFANGQVTIVGARNIFDTRDVITKLYAGLVDYFIT
ncbi:TATA-binding protein-like factor [Giardia duodenalis assemblage B]|uniref:TATA-binding protein-like factor n=2 Tax=Giardia intestinalis TaxID=5741 RepID=A0A132NQ15_GIAIN|nr:TATA-box binding protein [Giardia intestinalis]KWX12121.1 TATA-binding protein-like factor [Giardia intestinalis assemblage B]